MRIKMTLKGVISVVKLSLFPVWCWPQPQDATKFKMFCVKMYHYLAIIVLICVMLPLLYSINSHLDHPEIAAQQILLTNGTIHAIFNYIFYHVNYHHIQNVTLEMVHFSSTVKPHEEVLIQRYIDKCVAFHGASILLFYIFTFVSIVIPFVTGQPFPTLAEYPFDVFYQPLQTIIYIQLSMAGLLIAGQLCTNIFIALLLWFTTARFEILTVELGKATNIYEVYKCIKKHQELFEYSREVALVTRPFAFISICCSTTSCITSLFAFSTKQPIVVLLQLAGISILCLSEVFMYTWAAEYFMFMSHNVTYTAFHMLENNHLDNLIEIWKCLQIIIMRSQKPVTISIPCVLPTLSQTYFTSYLSVIYSYYTTLRAMTADTKN